MVTAASTYSWWAPRRRQRSLRRKQDQQPEIDRRTVYINTNPRAADRLTAFPRNEIRSTKYTVFTFLPKNLFEQFRRVANTYFLLLVVLQYIKALELSDPIIAAIPIVCIVTATAMKDGLEDFRRRIQDKRLNEEVTITLVNWVNVNLSTPTLWMRITSFFSKNQHSRSAGSVLPSEAVWRNTKWKDVCVGDFLLLRNNDNVPADMVILATSEEESICYVETKSLDGETNLKVKRGPTDLNWLKTPQDCAQIRVVVEAEHPNTNLFHFQGTLLVADDSLKRRETSRKANIELRRSKLNTATQGSSTTISEMNNDSSQDNLKQASLPIIPEENDHNENGHEQQVPTQPTTLERAQFKKIPLGVHSLMLRGCYLRNTDWVIGLALYTGSQSKIALNSGITPSKRTRIERQLNPQVILNFVILFALCLMCCVTHIIYFSAFNFEKAPFALETDTRTDNVGSRTIAVVTFFLCMIIFQNLVPISLYVVAEITKTIQAYFIHCDEEMYDAKLDKSCSVKSWNLSDDLGQIEYIFSDKTGTLTQNVMEFQRCCINGVIYGEAYHKTKDEERKAMVISFREKLKRVVEYRASNRTTDPEVEVRYSFTSPEGPVSFVDKEMMGEFLDPKSLQAERVYNFFLHLAICHTVIPEKTTNLDNDRTVINYKAQSPDEAALVETARQVGFTFLNRSLREIVVDVLGEVRVFNVLETLEFTSTRKRMSVIIKDADGQILLYCKGADSIIFERLADDQDELCETTLHQLQYFANDGLRTLCIAYRKLTTEEFEEWHEKYLAATIKTQNRDEAMEAVATTIEQGLVLLGATAIEDKLQDEVPMTIYKLLSAGIKIWVLTGDKLETAITIGFSCNLLQKSMTLIIIQGDSFESVNRQLCDSLATLFAEGTHNATYSSHALVIDGNSLQFALLEENRLLFLEVGCRCKSVICCRVSPLQKAQVVALVRKELDCLSLAIGDGANDVSMIQEANVGVGIAGMEGYQAVMASDYAISQFRFLQRLLLVHGRWNYRRISLMNLTFFYKNIIWVLVLFWSQFYCGFSADIIFEYSYINYYNVFFTILPSFCIGLFDQDVNDYYALRYPGLYHMGLFQQLYNMPQFWMYIADAVYQSLVCYFAGQYLYWDSIVSSNGFDSMNYEMGTAMAMYAITITNIYICMNTKNWTWIVFVCSFINIVIFPLYLVVFSLYSVDSPIYGLERMFLCNPTFWLSLFVVIAIALLPRFMSNYIMSVYYKTDADIVREIQKFGLPVLDEEESDNTRSASSNDYTDSFCHMASTNQLVQENSKDMGSVLSLAQPLCSDSNQNDTWIPGQSIVSPTPISNTRSSSRSMLALDTILRPLMFVTNTVKDFRGSMRQQKERLRSRAKLIKPAFRPALLLYMGDERVAPNTGFAFSGDVGLQAVVSPHSNLSPDFASDSNIQMSSRRDHYFREDDHNNSNLMPVPNVPIGRRGKGPPKSQKLTHRKMMSI